ncbi:RNA polymerase RpoN-/SigL-like sigma 54 subunit [Hydrogenispora ethanolica]|uniref:RNA polymerase RpoN-/SigL-like sigma 54 subunit n=1 Tax=Hydrogenispora ethanolica TaxID=1082276 RepID=A0A4R1SCI1_HYDET|nr:RNA polymerase factor sigma-54 [Hydrogenispora ethanolica]TCL76730.1 RNA polymerase RpoN-/SigL-like sigma 54 subunit [Hydrogenispora ethanolica]
MNPVQHQNLETVQKLALTPELRQSLAVLQMTAAELQSFLGEQLADNCLLEVEEAADAGREGPDEADGADAPEKPQDVDVRELAAYLLADDEREETAAFSAGRREEAPVYPEAWTDESQSLQDYLLQQLRLCAGSGAELAIGQYLVAHIDDDGYLRCSTHEAAAVFGVEDARVEKVVRLVQSFDPAGVGARSISECLSLQIEAAEAAESEAELRAIAAAIARDYLEELAGRKLNQIAHQLKKPLEKVQAAAHWLRSLNPRPGRLIGTAPLTEYIIPDVTIRAIGNDWLIAVNEPDSARLRVSAVYRQMLRQEGAMDRQSQDFFEKKLRAAVSLIKAVEQRRATLYKMAEAILHLQGAFFSHGPSGLKPLTLKRVAEEAGFHESTVSRSLADKYVATPFGVYPFQYFFTSGIATDDQQAASSTVIKGLLKQIIAGEAKAEPFSDQQLAEVLKERGVRISRRTIAKYREELDIPPSNLRRAY